MLLCYEVQVLTMFAFPLQVAIPVVSVRLVKKHRTAGLVPNGLAITVDTSQKVHYSTQQCSTKQYNAIGLYRSQTVSTIYS